MHPHPRHSPISYTYSHLGTTGLQTGSVAVGWVTTSGFPVVRPWPEPPFDEGTKRVQQAVKSRALHHPHGPSKDGIRP